MKTEKAVIGLIITTFMALICPTLVLPQSDPIVLESGFVRVEIFASGFEGPTGLAFDDRGNLYITNEYSTTVSKVSPDGIVTTFANGFFGPSGVAFNFFEGNLYVSDDTDRVFKVNPTGSIEVFATTPGNPNAIAFDSFWNLYVVLCAGSISKVTPEGNVSFFAGGFACPESAVFDNDDNLYTSDFSYRVFKITPEEDVTVYATFSGATEGGLAFDESGNLYISSLANCTVYRITPEGVLTPFVTGFDETIPDNFPRGLIFDNEGSLYITEYGTGIVWRVVSVRQAIKSLIAKVVSLNLQRGLENSLIKKLETAKKSITRGNNNATKNKLKAFINEVEAQRGKKLTDEEANALIIVVQCIIDNI